MVKLLRKIYGNMKIRWKIFASMVFIAIFASGTIGFFSYRNASNIANDRYMKVLAGTLAQVDINLSGQVKNVEAAASSIAWNDEIRKILSRKDKNVTLSEQLKDMEKMQSFIISSTRNQNIQLKLYTRNDAIYKNERVFFFSQDELADKKWYKELASSKFTILWDYTNLNNGTPAESRELSCIMPIKGINDFSESVGYVQAIIQENQLKSILESLRLTSDSAAFLIDSEKNIISCSGSTDKNRPMSDKLMEAAFSTDKYNFVEEDGQRCVLINRALGYSNWRIAYITPYKTITSSITDDLRFYIFWFIGIMAVALLMSVFISDSMTRRISSLAKNMRDFKGKEVEIKLPAKYNEEVDVFRLIETRYNKKIFLQPKKFLQMRYNDEITELQCNFKDMVYRINELIREVYLKDIEKKDAELKAFQAQINPHFLYNTLDTINWMALEKNEYEISSMIGLLSAFFRLSLKHGDNIIRIEDELEHVKVYLSIQQKRFEGSLESEISVEPDIFEYMTVKLILQPLVENAILHGIQKTEAQAGKIVIRGRKLGDRIVLSVEDNGAGADLDKVNGILAGANEGKQRSGYGIYNTNERIRLFFGEGYGLKYYRSCEGGTIAECCFPAKLYVLGQVE